MYLQFSDSTRTVAVSWSALPQDAQVFPHAEAVEPDDPRYLAYLEHLPEAVRANMPQPTN